MRHFPLTLASACLALSCVSQTAYSPCEECVTEHDCAVRRVFQQVRDETARILDGTTLADAARMRQTGDVCDTRHPIELGSAR